MTQLDGDNVLHSPQPSYTRRQRLGPRLRRSTLVLPSWPWSIAAAGEGVESS